MAASADSRRRPGHPFRQPCLLMFSLPLATNPKNRHRLARGRRAGFSLIVVVVVVTVLAIIAGVVVPQVNSVVDDARTAAVLKDLHEFTFAIERYRADHNGATPDLIQGDVLVQLMQTTDQDGNI